MKKLVCLLVAMILCLSCVALAAAAPSKTTSNLTKTETEIEIPVDAPAEETKLVIEMVVELDEENQEMLEAVQQEIEKLAASESVEAYFGELLDEEGNVIDLKALLEADVLYVHEFYPLVANGYSMELGEVSVTLLFPTPYEVGEKVLIMIGIVTVNEDGTQSIEWKVFEAYGVEVEAGLIEEQGAINVVLDAETVLAIQEGRAYLAVVSK